MLKLEAVMDRADELYTEARPEKLHRGVYGIESEQVKALAKALVEHFNAELDDLKRQMKWAMEDIARNEVQKHLQE